MNHDRAWTVLAAGITVGLAVALSACAGVQRAPSRPAVASYALPPLPALDPAQARGLAFATRRCGGCHNVGLDGGPPYDGPAFRKVAAQYDPASLERRFAQVSAHGFDRMPPITFTPAEANDLVAYFDSMRGIP